MKDIEMTRNHDFRAKARVIVHYKAGKTYQRVPEAAVRSIVSAGAGHIIVNEDGASPKLRRSTGE